MNVFEKIVDRLEEAMPITWKHDYLGGKKDAFVEAISIVKELAEEYGKDNNVPTNDGWIPVEEGLPKEKADVLVWHSDLDMHCVAWYNSATQKWHSNDFELSFEDSKDVIAWQPLPAPYQPKGE